MRRAGGPGRAPEARLPRALERMAMRRYGRSARTRVGTAAALKAVAVLVRRHPKVAAEVLAAGVGQAGRTGAAELRRFVAGSPQQGGPGPAERRSTRIAKRGLSAADRRKLRALVKAHAQGNPAPT